MRTFMDKILHIIPAAGKATRIGGIPKFLLPIGHDNFLIKYHVENLLENFVDCKKIIATNTENYETIKRMHLNAEILTVNTTTMNETVNLVISQYPEYENYLVTMPDTYYKDFQTISDLVNEFNNSDSLISTAIWEIQDYQIGNLGQVKTSKKYLVDVIDKDPECEYIYCWGAIIWNKNLNKFIQDSNSHIGYMLKPIIDSGLNIDFKIAKDIYFDCGTFEEYSLLIKSL